MFGVKEKNKFCRGIPIPIKYKSGPYKFNGLFFIYDFYKTKKKSCESIKCDIYNITMMNL